MLTWDEPKRRANLVKHGLDFADAERFEMDTALVMPSRAGRYIAIGLLDDTVIAIVIKPLGIEATAIISMRPASRRERMLYAQT
jgi:uncharacterized DUF497 family protein